MIKIVITGPESTGKSTLASQLASYFKVPLVLEYARRYIDQLQRAYEVSDLLKIAEGQLILEEYVIDQKLPLLICDTDLITIKIWSEVKYGYCDPQILEWINSRHYDHYLLCSPEIPWENDPQRENPDDRSELYQIYKKELEANEKDFTEIQGDEKTRLETTIRIIKNLYSI